MGQVCVLRCWPSGWLSGNGVSGCCSGPPTSGSTRTCAECATSSRTGRLATNQEVIASPGMIPAGWVAGAGFDVSARVAPAMQSIATFTGTPDPDPVTLHDEITNIHHRDILGYETIQSASVPITECSWSAERFRPPSLLLFGYRVHLIQILYLPGSWGGKTNRHSHRVEPWAPRETVPAVLTGKQSGHTRPNGGAGNPGQK